jgi:hypothetical protein
MVPKMILEKGAQLVKVCADLPSNTMRLLTSRSDVFSEDAENPLIPTDPRSTKPRKLPVAMHLQNPSLLSKQLGEVHLVVQRDNGLQSFVLVRHLHEASD